MVRLKALVLTLVLLCSALLAVPATAEPTWEVREFNLDGPGIFLAPEEPQDSVTVEEEAPAVVLSDGMMKQDILDNDTKDDIYDLLIFCMVLSIFSTVIATVTAVMVVRRR